MRYDLKLDFKRMETVKAEKGYHGPAVVCAIYFTPVAGYIPDRPVIKYLAAQRNIEIAFVPIAGTRILVPFRMMIPTPLGTAMLEATAVHHHGRAAAGGEDAVMLVIRLVHSGDGGARSAPDRGVIPRTTAQPSRPVTTRASRDDGAAHSPAGDDGRARRTSIA